MGNVGCLDSDSTYVAQTRILEEEVTNFGRGVHANWTEGGSRILDAAHLLRGFVVRRSQRLSVGVGGGEFNHGCGFWGCACLGNDFWHGLPQQLLRLSDRTPRAIDDAPVSGIGRVFHPASYGFVQYERGRAKHLSTGFFWCSNEVSHSMSLFRELAAGGGELL